VEQLEKRELLNGSPVPAPQAANPLNASLAQVASLASPLADTLLPGYTLPSSIAPLVNKASTQGWQGTSQLPAASGPLLEAPTSSKGPMLQMPLVILPNQSSNPSGEGYTPSQLQQAYGFNQIALPAGETFNDAGSNQTIAIVDPLNDPYLRTDLQTFDQTFNIGGAAHDATSTSFLKVINQNGGSTLPDTDIYNLGLETSLDVEWAHAMAPGANIVVVETSTFFNLNDLGTAIETAASQPGVSVVSMSFGFGDSTTEYYLDNLFTTPAGHQGVSFVASAGDNGSNFAEYPAISPNVLGVGGTTLPADASGNPSRVQESTWVGGGGGISRIEAEPAYQLGVQSTGSRAGPDLAYDSDPTTGVPVLDTLYGNAAFPGQNKPWIEIGGTSMAAPQISSLVAIANQLRVAGGGVTLDGANQLLPAIYQIAATDPNAFHDITVGNNGHPAGPGYDFASGFGSPNAKYLVPDLVTAFKTPPAPRTLYWTGDVSTNWDTPGNWSTVDPAVKNVQQSVLPTAADRVVVDLTGATILHDTANYDTISSFSVTATKVTLDIGAGTIDLSGGGGRGTFRVAQNGDKVTMETGILANADVTVGTSLSATSDANGIYPELDNVQVDGTINANQSGGNNGLYFQNNLILNGTINLGGNKDQSSQLFAGFWSPYLSGSGSQDNNPETISGSGTIQLGQSVNGDALYNWGTLGTFTIGPNITIVGGGSGSVALFQQTNFTGSLDNQGTIRMNGGVLVIQAFGPSLFGWEPSGTTGWTNEGTITASGATVGLLGGWINSGKISLDSHCTVLLGNSTAGQLASDPAAGYNAWSSSGSMTIADGATVYVGGFVTADQYEGLAAIPGVAAHLAADVRLLDGTLDNSPASNAVSHGTLSTTSTPLTMAGGTIIGGTISAGSKVQVIAATPIPTNILNNGNPTIFESSGGSLVNLTNSGTVAGTAATLTLSNVTNTGTVSGATAAVIEFQNTWANTGTLKVDGASSLYLGTPASSDVNFPATLADGSPYAWNPAAAGTIQVADGATVGLGGLLTTDQFTALPSLPNFSIHLAHDTVLLDGWLDNKPADNPVTGGVLALTSATGSVGMYGGYISGGSITTTGSTALNILIPSNGPFYDFASVLDGVTNNGTIAMVSDFLELEGNVVNNGTLTDSGEEFFAIPDGSLTNNGIMSFTFSFADMESPVTNHGTMTLSSSEFFIQPYGGPVSLTNTGTISLTSATLDLGGNLTNSGTVSVSSGSAEFGGNYDNTHGTITVDSASTLELGRSTLQQQNFPTFTDGSPYAFDPSKVGTIQVADGAQLELGGLMTTDQWNGFASLPGVSVHVAKDLLFFTGWLDNSPADNPISGGVLSITAGTGPLNLSGGYIYHGKITTNGVNDLEATEVGVLDGVELDGNLNATGRYGFGRVYVENSMTLNGTIVMPGVFGELLLGFFDNTADAITGTGTISMGTSSTSESVVDNLSNVGLTIGSGITINAGARVCYFVSEGTQTNVLGTVKDDTASSTLYTYGVDHNTFTTFQSLANLNGGTLTGGTWEFSGGATWRTFGADITANAANLSISGAGTQILDSLFGQGNNALAGLTVNTGDLTVGAGYSLTVLGNFQNAGILEIAGTLSIQGNYTQTAGAALDIDIASPTLYGSLTVSGTATLAGTVNIALVNGFTPASGQSYTILTFGARSGDFSAKNGLVFSPTEAFAANYTANTLRLVVVP
jgi:hypothetical protein